jgi:hypothetical protein
MEFNSHPHSKLQQTLFKQHSGKLKKQLESDLEVDSDEPVVDDDTAVNMNDILTQVEDENCKYEVYETLIT